MKNIRKIIKISKPLHKLFLIIWALVLTSTILQLTSPIANKYVVDEIEKELQKGNGDKNRLITFIALSFGAAFFSTLITSLNNRIGDHMSGELRRFLTSQFYTKVLTLSQSYFDSELSGKVINQLNRGINSIKDFAGTVSNFILPTLVQTLVSILLLIYLNQYVALFILLLFPVYLTISNYSTKRWGRLEEGKNKLEDQSRGRIQEVITNIRLVKSSTTENSEINFIEENQKEVNKIYAKQSRDYHILDFLREQSLNIILGAVNLVVFISAFNKTLTFGEMVLIIQLVAQIRTPLFAMSYILTQIEGAEVGSKEYFAIMDLESREKLPQNEQTVQRFKNVDIKFKDVLFQYEDDKKVLDQISFNIKQGEKVALVGPSGSGKSTIVNLLLKLYTPQSGEIEIGGQKYSLTDHFDIRGNIGLVFQDNELFSTTIRENVIYGNTNLNHNISKDNSENSSNLISPSSNYSQLAQSTPNTHQMSDQLVWEALEAANAKGFVEKLKDGLNSEIGERGVKLSGGQKQRLQIARAILKNAPILILDEATSNLDAKSEHEVQMALDKLLEGKTALIIAHRLSTIQNVDKILVLDEGKIVQEGSPDKLAQEKGIYRDLLQYQVSGNKKLLEKFEIY